MRALIMYTVARVWLFLITFGLLWVVGSRWLTWNEQTVLALAVAALVVSAVASLWLLRGLRADLSAHVDARARRVSQTLDNARRAEDD
ncbi:MAG: DUF4229 domain-containing protein [Nocardioidaceae bacterium]|nr:DUF4229 domain-containing protein [Nocardioidaceae bacterium]